jgi:hypothetical protein
MKLLKEMLAPMYLGFALGAFAHLHWYQWELCAIIVPFFTIVKLTKFNNDGEN